jgi:hypothetical protein
MAPNVVLLPLIFVTGSDAEFDVGVGARSSAGSEQQRWRSDMPRSLAQEGEPRCAPRLPTDGDPRAHPAYSGRPAVDLATAQPPPRRRPSPGRRLRWPSTACASFERHALTTWQITSRSWIRRATTPTPPIPAGGCLAHRRAPGLHSGRKRTRDRPDTGRPHRTPTPGRSDARTGHRTRGQARVDTGRSHRTLDAERRPRTRTGDKARPASGPPGPATPSERALGRPTVFLWTAPAALDSPAGSA